MCCIIREMLNSFDVLMSFTINSVAPKEYHNKCLFGIAILLVFRSTRDLISIDRFKSKRQKEWHPGVLQPQLLHHAKDRQWSDKSGHCS